jgi:hypothetical protein
VITGVFGPIVAAAGLAAAAFGAAWAAGFAVCPQAAATRINPPVQCK